MQDVVPADDKLLSNTLVNKLLFRLFAWYRPVKGRCGLAVELYS
jgi:hypothetical protein